MFKNICKLLTVCAISSMMIVGASATYASPGVQLSEVAGETITCNVHIADKDGIFETKSIDIQVPDDATKQETEELISKSSEQVASEYVKLPRYYGDKVLYEKKGRILKHVSSGNGSVIANVTLDDKDYYMMGVFFSNISYLVEKVNCSIMDTDIGVANSYYLNIEPNQNLTCNALFMVGQPTDGQNVFEFYPNQNLNFFGSCKTSSGLDGIADVLVRGYYTY